MARATDEGRRHRAEIGVPNWGGKKTDPRHEIIKGPQGPQSQEYGIDWGAREPIRRVGKASTSANNAQPKSWAA